VTCRALGDLPFVSTGRVTVLLHEALQGSECRTARAHHRQMRQWAKRRSPRASHWPMETEIAHLTVRDRIAIAAYIQ
jgi:hypothetical protein